jgi:hypothetical protein
MKTTALIITASAGLALAGCGAGAKVPPQPHPKRGVPIMTFPAPTTTTIADAPTGQAMACTNHGISANAHVPSAGNEVTNSNYGVKASATLDLTRNTDGSLSVSCIP